MNICDFKVTDGKVAYRFGPTTTPEKFQHKIEQLL